MKKIAYILPCYPVLSETFISTEISAMREVGHEIVPISLSRPHGRVQRIDMHKIIGTVYFDNLHFKDALSGIFSIKSIKRALIFALNQHGIGIKSLLYSALKILHVVRKLNCDHIHAHFAESTTAFAIVVARLANISVSFVSHGHDMYATPSDLQLKLRSSDLAVAVCKEMLKDYRVFCPTANTELVYCGIDPERFQPSLNNEDKNGKFLFIGRLCETKGIFDLIDAFEMIPDSIRPQLDMIGEGVLYDQIKEAICNKNLNAWISLLGAKDSDWIIEHGPKYLSLLSSFKKAANGDRDTGPVVVKEAMAMGLPVITTDFMGCKEMVSNETGFKVREGDSEALAATIKYFMTLDQKTLSQMSNNARKRVIKYFTAKQQAKTLSYSIEAL